MDPISQGALGALVAQSATDKSHLGKAAVIGGLAALAPDLDVLIQSSADPMLALEYHRHFTHSLFFAPLGGLLCAGLFYRLLGKLWSVSFSQVLVWSMLGFVTHGPLDLCTSYGTSLLWPVSDQRLSLDLVSVIDPLVTLPMVFAVLLARWARQRRIAALGLVWLGACLSLGAWQQGRVESIAREVAIQRGHDPRFLRAMPTLGNLLVWRIVYESGGYFFVDGAGAGPSGVVHWPGSSVPVADLRVSLPGLADDTQQRIDAQRFAHFSQGYIGLLAADEGYRIGDIRYGAIPTDSQPLWGITIDLSLSAEAHAGAFVPAPDGITRLSELKALIIQAWRGS